MKSAAVQDRRDSLTTAIVAAGGIRKFCEAHGVTHQAVYAWRRRGAVPLTRALAIEEAHGVPLLSLVEPSVADMLRDALTKAQN